MLGGSPRRARQHWGSLRDARANLSFLVFIHMLRPCFTNLPVYRNILEKLKFVTHDLQEFIDEPDVAVSDYWFDHWERISDVPSPKEDNSLKDFIVSNGGQWPVPLELPLRELLGLPVDVDIIGMNKISNREKKICWCLIRSLETCRSPYPPKILPVRPHLAFLML